MSPTHDQQRLTISGNGQFPLENSPLGHFPYPARLGLELES